MWSWAARTLPSPPFPVRLRSPGGSSAGGGAPAEGVGETSARLDGRVVVGGGLARVLLDLDQHGVRHGALRQARGTLLRVSMLAHPPRSMLPTVPGSSGRNQEPSCTITTPGRTSAVTWAAHTVWPRPLKTRTMSPVAMPRADASCGLMSHGLEAVDLAVLVERVHVVVARVPAPPRVLGDEVERVGLAVALPSHSAGSSHCGAPGALRVTVRGDLVGVDLDLARGRAERVEGRVGAEGGKGLAGCPIDGRTRRTPCSRNCSYVERRLAEA